MREESYKILTINLGNNLSGKIKSTETTQHEQNKMKMSHQYIALEIIAIEFKGDKFHSLLPCMNDDLPDHIKGTAYWVPLEEKGS
jgi:hypothetical protein